MPLDRSEWNGAVDGPRSAKRSVRLTAIVDRNDRTGSGAFKALTDQGHWWVKPLNNPQGPRVPITEMIIGGAGALIEAPVCEVALVEIPTDLAGEQYRPGLALESGYASGSRDLGGVLEERDLVHRSEDDNRRRHAGVYAFYDWCWGEDDQWLYAPTEENRIYSHDHGHYLPGGPQWTPAHLTSSVDDPHPQQRPSVGLDPTTLDLYADRLERVRREEIAGMLRTIPAEWPVQKEELETVGWFLERRAPQVGTRIRAVAQHLRGGTSA